MSRAIVAAALEAIYTERGQLTPGDVVEVARDEDHPLHPHFTWDDGKAAAAYRLNEARSLIRSVQVKIVTDDAEMRVRHWHAARDVDESRSGYLPESEVRADPVAREVLLRSMRRDWLRFRSRYQHMAEFWSLVKDEDSADGTGAVAAS